MDFRKRRTKDGGGPMSRKRTRPSLAAQSANARKAASAGGKTGRRMAIELYRIAFELLRLPAAIYMRIAERAGALVLSAWLVVWPLLRSGARAARSAIAIAERQITPGRATLAVGVAAAIALAASQFTDYRAITIGNSAYTDVEGVAPPPEVGTSSAGSAHAWAGLPLAAFALVILGACALGRWRAARLLVPIGTAVVAISLLVDRPRGLDEGEAAIAYDGASASLLGGFWAQLVSGVLLIVLVPLILRQLDPTTDARNAKTIRPGKRLRLRRLSFRRNRPATGASQ